MSGSVCMLGGLNLCRLGLVLGWVAPGRDGAYCIIFELAVTTFLFFLFLSLIYEMHFEKRSHIEGNH